MKVRSIFPLLAGCWLATGAFGAVPGYTPMKIIQTEAVDYPRLATSLGVTTGEVQVVVQIDEKGRLTDTLVTGYTYLAFADAAVAALKTWRYQPAWVDGEPHSATANLTFSFSTKGFVVVDLTVNNVLEVLRLQRLSGYYQYLCCTLSQLDRIPTPVKVVQPRYPVDPATLAKPVVVTVHFYIDQQGRVRMPAVSRETSQENDAFAAEAVAAISQWQFEPPLSKGQPVLVSAQQDFHFSPKS